MSRREGSRRLATLLFTDIVGSTTIARELGDLRWRALIRLHHEIVRRELKRFEGHELDTAGDGFFAIFDSPGAAIRCAVALTEAVREVGLEIRAGLHSGEVEIAGGKPAGIGVNTAARVMSVAGHGEVLVSQALRDIVAGSSLRFEDHGVHTLKGIDGEWWLFLVTEVDGQRVAEPLDDAEAARRRMAIDPTLPPRRRRLAVIGLAAIATVSIVVAGVLWFGPSEEDGRGGPLIPPALGPPAGSVAWVDARTGELIGSRSDLPNTPGIPVHDIEVAYGSVWIMRIPVLAKVDPQDGSSVAVSGVDPSIAVSIGVGLDRVWLVGRRLLEIDPATGDTRRTIRYVDSPRAGLFLAAQDVTTGFGEVWIASNDGSVQRVDPATGEARHIEVGDAPSRIAAGTDAIWVLDDAADTVWRIDPETEAVDALGVSGGLDELAIADGFVWVLSDDLGTLTPISESTRDVRRGLDVGADATDVAGGLGSVWVSSGGDILEIDTTTARVIRTIDIGDVGIEGLAVDDESATIWLDMAPSR